MGASSRTQLKVDRPEYLAGEKVVISGKIYTPNFTPLVEASVAGELTITPSTQGGTTPAEATPSDSAKALEKTELHLIAAPDHPGEYQAEFTPKVPGEYRFSTTMDPKAVVKFEVLAPKLEQSETAMNESLMQSMARISGGKFLREEDLDSLPNLVSSHSATVPTFKKVELYYSVWWMVALMVIASLEWLLRRLWQLK